MRPRPPFRATSRSSASSSVPAMGRTSGPASTPPTRKRRSLRSSAPPASSCAGSSGCSSSSSFAPASDRRSRSRLPSIGRSCPRRWARLAATTRFSSSLATPAGLRRWRSGWNASRGSSGGRLMERIVLAYSGGLDTSAAIPWMAERYDAEIIAVTMDLGQGRELEEVRDRALPTGATRAHVLDLREEFARDYILPALKADAIYEDRYPMATALGRPLIGQKLVEIAEIEQATAIAHGCTGKGNDQVRLDVTTRRLNPNLKVIAPAREWGMTRPEEIEYARTRGVPVPATVASPYSTDSNLWGRSIECGVLEDPWTEPPEEIYALTKSPAECPDA